jgi:Tfp pilus assembly protein PilX
MTRLHVVMSPVRPSRQAGMATLVTSLVIMILATILVMAVSKTTLMEQRISSNEIRSRQAAEAAEAGVNYGVAYVMQTTLAGATVPIGADKNNDNIADTIALTTMTSGTSNSYSVSFCDPTASLATMSCPDTPGPVVCTAAPATYLSSPRIVACGWSDDALGRAMISQGVGTASGIANPPTNPLTSKGAVNVTGSATVTNYFNNLTVWSGGSLSNIGNSGKTFVRNPTIAPPDPSVAPPTPPSTCSASTDYVCTTDKNSTGPDVIDADPTLSNLTNAQMFTNYFGVTDVAAYQATIATMPNMTDSTAGSLSGVMSQSIVVTGDLTSNMNFTIGSRDRPVVLIINGNWRGAGNTTIYGIVFITGDVNLSGGKTIYGGAAIEGSVSGTGSLDVIYDPLVASNAANHVGKPGLIPGTWRDWK